MSPDLPVMPRVLEPEVMDGEAQSAAYAEADFEAPDRAFVDRFCARYPDFVQGQVLDMGCGPAAIARYLCETLPNIRVTGVDASGPMIAHGRRGAERAGLAERITLLQGYFPGVIPADASFDAVISNSLLHHLPDPSVLWEELRRLVRPSAPILVTDLTRPATTDAARAIVATYAADEPDILQEDFYVSLLAAFTPEEVTAQLAASGLGYLVVERISDRHLAVHGHLR